MMTGLVTIYAIWLRESMTFWREKGRIVGMIGQPLLYLLILGNGITAGMKLNSAGNVGYIQFLYPGVIAMSILFTSIFSAISIIWDRDGSKYDRGGGLSVFVNDQRIAHAPDLATVTGKLP